MLDKWQMKLGLIVPSWNTVNEYEFQRVLAPAVSVHSTRIKITADDEENFTRMATQVPVSAQLLAQARVQIICYGCLAGGFIKGPGHDQEIVRGIEEGTGIPGVAAAAAVVDALQSVGVRRVSVASPYESWLNDKLKEYLNAFGIEVIALKGLGTQEHASFTPDQNAELAMQVDRPESEAILISCSNFRTLEMIEIMEKKLGKPVLTSNMCSLWKMLRRLGDRRCLPGTGLLFRNA